nr:hypothetical protein [Tanacetum cinerariifolium]
MLLCSESHIVKDFVKRLSSTLGEEGNHYIEPTDVRDSKDGKHIGFRRSLLIKCLTIYMHHLRGSVSLLPLIFITTARYASWQEPIKDQPLPTDASPTALSPGYIVDFNPKEDEEDPKEDPTDYPADGGDNEDDESSDDDDNDDDVEKDEEEEEEYLALADPSAVSTNDPVPSR